MEVLYLIKKDTFCLSIHLPDSLQEVVIVRNTEEPFIIKVKIRKIQPSDPQ